jgi:hypothetical protein
MTEDLRLLVYEPELFSKVLRTLEWQ